jgi:putative endonuclease
LKAVFACGEDEGEAKRIETFIKKQKSRKFLERMIVGEALYGGLAQLVRVPYVQH